jgi:hypothetical protein
MIGPAFMHFTSFQGISLPPGYILDFSELVRSSPLDRYSYPVQAPLKPSLEYTINPLGKKWLFHSKHCSTHLGGKSLT